MQKYAADGCSNHTATGCIGGYFDAHLAFIASVPLDYEINYISNII